jgi:hypothetical protein
MRKKNVNGDCEDGFIPHRNFTLDRCVSILEKTCARLIGLWTAVHQKHETREVIAVCVSGFIKERDQRT